MTSAARPTFNPAKGNTHQGGNRLHAPTQQTSAKDQPGHTQLKLRRPGQSAPGDLRAKDLRAELEARERKHFEAKGRPGRAEDEDEADRPPPMLEYSGSSSRKREEEDDDEAEEKRRSGEEKNIDADDSDSSDSDDDSDDDSDEDDGDSEDETAELMRELEKIKREREEERRKQEAEREREEAERRDNEVKFGNPLLAAQQGGAAATFNVKKRWYEEVVFKNQAKDEPQKKKRFINDTIRNDFHKKFLSKYIQ